MTVELTPLSRSNLLEHLGITAGDPHGGVAIHAAILATSSQPGHASAAHITTLDQLVTLTNGHTTDINFLKSANISAQEIRQEYNHTVKQSLSTTWQDIDGGSFDFTPVGSTGETKITFILHSHAASDSASVPGRFSTRLNIDGTVQDNSQVFNRVESGAVNYDEDFTRIHTVPTWGTTEKTIAFQATEFTGYPTKIGETYGYDQTAISAQKTQTNLIIIEWLV